MFQYLSRRSSVVVDPGSAWLRVRAASGVLAMPSCVAFLKEREHGERRPVATGEAAWRLLGRTPSHIELIRAFRAGHLASASAASWLLDTAFTALSVRRARCFVSVPADADEHGRAALSELLLRSTHNAPVLVTQPLAAARGAGLRGADGCMVVDIGAACTHVAVICDEQVVAAATIEVGGETFDGAIARLLRRDHGLAVGPQASERAKLAVGAAADPPRAPVRIAGRCLRRNVPREVELSADTLLPAFHVGILAIASGIRRVLEQAPSEAAAAAIGHGLLLVGGASQLRHIDRALRDETGLAVLPVDQPEEAVLRGLSIIAQESV